MDTATFGGGPQGTVHRRASRRRRLSDWAAMLVAVPLAVAAGGASVGSASVARPWVALASLAEARGALAAASDNAGRIYAIGGAATAYDSSLAGTYVEVYTPATKAWSSAPTLIVPRSGGPAAATGTDGRIYAIGGEGASYVTGGGATAEVLDPSATPAHWTLLGSKLATSRVGLAAATDSLGRIYAIGGGSQSVERYDPTETPVPSWHTVADMSVPRSGLAAVTTAGGLIYAVGGDTQNTVEVYTPPAREAGPAALGSWAPAGIPPLPLSRRGFAAAAGVGADGRNHMYVIGGCTTSATACSQFTDPPVDWVDAVDLGDPSRGWKAMSPMPTARNALALASGLGTDKQFYAVAGQIGGGRITGHVESYAPALDSAPPPRPSATAALAMVDVRRVGSGSGSVVSDLPDRFIDCGVTCTHRYPIGSTVTLTATVAPGSGSAFAGWEGDCSGTTGPVCHLTVQADHYTYYGQGNYPTTGYAVGAGFSGCTAGSPDEFCVLGKADPPGWPRVPAPQNAVVDGSGSTWFTYNSAPDYFGGASQHGGDIGRRKPDGTVEHFDIPPAVTRNDSTLHSTGPTAPYGIAIGPGPDPYLWFTDPANERIGRFKLGTPGSIAMFVLPPRVNMPGVSPLIIDQKVKPMEITTGPDGNMWFTVAEGLIGTVAQDGAHFRYFDLGDGTKPGPGAEAIVAGPDPKDRSLWFTIPSAGPLPSSPGKVGRIIAPATPPTLDLGVPGLVPVETVKPDIKLYPAGSQPFGIAAGPDGAIWFTNSGGSSVGRLQPKAADPGSTIETFAFRASNSQPAARPLGITAAPDGNIWFTEADTNLIGKIDPASHRFSEYPIPTEHSQPLGIVADWSGR
ncbi:MAG: hypothetical protein ABR532_09100, partial [Candidatus Dormibacteria bacterium]